ncbi:MAG: hypothetical protein UR85_C0004G0057 [Candidatus Nomurabacteria bacterium GW2011_GWF2_35_66]|uniref:Uncharacterized protein n=1 Tax=Candidatus Nomurabacteria bacterium GW2011_GWE1_35_16 TaxID=1618761 RepID=A0A0G0EHR3_9BACT|nr:MAG: hypothetical protein UR55_C0002G0056 [Candidatus Nomurabacteria bacterium GW2011_GWF1_34_20]KKP63635.1 MAG: hypothetical protein UR57_C0002G0056 [Candidatus Nomurabacteria bacterium GW2011_GWE2_34_25]KKP66837.1 MAG: hypothetical protein UR64_C0002G0053 [Candidatus Nomurabacteria bacterium GW2011_GWE1_35_16]KKP83463.1 MAG: hypothetical protein UR85_C0004G0057 [Candidatus Nomurabacteria bacterium GW2011_GWF2_35_66]HAE36605.1 hypothetical protein [Candidatus Nomurabacteria bacterium]
MNISKLRIALGILGTFFLSIIATYLYDIFFKNFFINITTWILDFFHKYRDKFIYEEVAKGFHNYESQLMFAMMIGIFCGLCVFIIVKHIKSKYSDKIINDQKIKKSFWFDITFATFFFFVMFIQQTQLSLINKLTTNFYQKLNTATPYMNIHEKDIFISNFSTIKSKKDYEKIIENLDILKSQNIN